MKLSMKTLVVALAVTGAAIPVVSANAAIGISINAGDVAFGYNDGYWDRGHQWHPWANPADARWYRTHYKSHYYARAHDHEREGGWRAKEWWHDEHHH